MKNAEIKRESGEGEGGISHQEVAPVDQRRISVQELRESFPGNITVVEVPAYGRMEVLKAPDGMLIDPTLGNGADVCKPAAGALGYTHFILMPESVSLLTDRAIIPAPEAWNENSRLPDWLRVTEWRSDLNETLRRGAGAALDAINRFDRDHGLMGYMDPENCRSYANHDHFIAQLQTMKLRDSGNWQGLGIPRAGALATKNGGYPIEKQFLAEGKRHGLVADPSRLGIGMILDEAGLDSMRGKRVVTREFAAATFSSLTALLAILSAEKALPAELNMMATVGSQAGAELFDGVQQWLANNGCDISVEVGRICTRMSTGEHPHYLEQLDVSFDPKTGVQENELSFMVSDGGDYADLLLPGHMRRLWPATVGASEIARLQAKITQCIAVVGEGNVDIIVARVLQNAQLRNGVELTAEKAVRAKYALAQEFPQIPNIRFAFGEAMIGKEYQDTRAGHQLAA